MAVPLQLPPYLKDPDQDPVNATPFVRRVLIVDDSPIVLQILSSTLSVWGYHVVTAGDGAEAWAMIQKMDIPLVIMDWRMPGMNGVDLCSAIRKTFGPRRHYLIMVTGDLTKESYQQFIDAGIDDFIGKPLDTIGIHGRIRNAERVMTLNTELEAYGADSSHVREDAKSRHLARLQQDIDAAATYQQSEIPQDSLRIESLQFETIFEPASTISGDTFNYFRADNDWTNFYSIDVAGHGIASGLLAVTLNTLLKAGSCAYRFTKDGVFNVDGKRISTPADLCADLNETFLSDDASRPYFTMLAGTYNQDDRLLRLCLAGHPPPILFRRSGEVEMLGENGFPVGLVDGADYDDISITLEPGDRFVCVTDGVTECEGGTDGRQFGQARMVQALLAHRSASLREMIEGLKSEVAAWRWNKVTQDDITILSFECME